uniref:YfkG n=1 Tax=Bacillus subtilis TaxID=1423 RepID=O32426_BACIU|nr:YfkG [Bacillus subtilis]
MLMVAVLSVGASACFMARFAFRVLFVMASAFFRMLGHHDIPPTSF